MQFTITCLLALAASSVALPSPSSSKSSGHFSCQVGQSPSCCKTYLLDGLEVGGAASVAEGLGCQNADGTAADASCPSDLTGRCCGLPLNAIREGCSVPADLDSDASPPKSS
ncbi:MAG: hypothetical protein M4579_003258 [Chaenotheca gracillima]|nr:MAG: hypothetical protein M4579_003258 [Chaenotheca gracillima]